MAQLARFQRRVDSKRRLALPADSGIAANQNAFVTLADDLVFVTKDKQVSDQLFAALRQVLETRKLNALREWEKTLKEAGLLHLSSAEIDKIVNQSLAPKRNRR